ncbi:MAG: helix-turn-helix transcriptional regulator [Acidimicrobiales bacterium]|nr:helix-turn-helix transcriptional regulator [Acidimicrobiales bacterium]MXX44274.1 helix-turn-helix transcriptional regulator [Acidimicrobiales bacterium]MXY04094.1 helix-turn-helix transcriptional regulator [Acidimicrobiales bacterium]MYA25916.1 helix-turn-helix transcriptional regulator [Acidimicrobiales bacterium]MYB80783.1 helix-turn-helix transcriptional regulator [Acidimicrobiales bacterium]
MSRLRFRNVDAEVSDHVAAWPYEALVAAIDRGLVPDWQPVFAEIRRMPWGLVARRVERYLAYRDPDGVGTLFALAIEHARTEAERAERAHVAARVRAAVERAGTTKAEFAASVGTSASRLSTYLNGKVTPSAATLVRIERTAELHQPEADQETRHGARNL